MKKLIPAILLFSSTALAGQAPFPDERLENSIPLKDSCSYASIIEWKDSTPDKESVEKINYYCNLAVNNYYKFMNSKYYSLQFVEMSYSFSLLEWDPQHGGTKPRNLNDTKDRFRDRVGFCDPYGNEITDTGVCSNGDPPLAVEAWTNYSLDIIFMRKDIYIDGEFNRRMEEVITHEVFHAMSDLTGANQKHSHIEEEVLAREFTRYLGTSS